MATRVRAPRRAAAVAAASAATAALVVPAPGEAAEVKPTQRATPSVSDGSASAGDTFTLTVNAASDAPTITDIANQTIDEDTSTVALAFTIGDADTAADNLTVSVSSSNLFIVPTANIGLDGSGATRTVRVTPAPHENGAVIISVTVSDGTLTATEPFTVTVNPINDAPTMATVADHTTLPGVPVGPLPLTVSDIDAGAQLTLTAASSNVAVVPVANVVFGGTDAANLIVGGAGGHPTVTVTPAAGQSGLAILTISVSDGLATASTSFRLTVASALTVTKTGPGEGTVTSMPAGVRCGPDCLETYHATTMVTLIARPAPDSSFAGWSGDADCTDGVVTLSATASRACTAHFTRLGGTAPLDLNGDGRGDAFTYEEGTGTWTQQTRAVAGDGGTARNPGPAEAGHYAGEIGQITADGRFTSTPGIWSPDWIVRGGEFNGDGRSDLLLYNPETGVWFKALTDSTPGSFTYQTGVLSPGWNPVALDLDGNGRSDVFVYHPATGQWATCLSTDTGLACDAVRTWDPNWELYPADFNADGKADLLLHNRTTGIWVRATNDGARDFTYVSGTWSPIWDVAAGDVDGDGRSDVVLYDPAGGLAFTALTPASGAGEFAYAPFTFAAGARAWVGDFDGNGLADVFLYDRTTGAWTQLLRTTGGLFDTFSSTWSPGWLRERDLWAQRRHRRQQRTRALAASARAGRPDAVSRWRPAPTGQAPKGLPHRNYYRMFIVCRRNPSR